MRRVIVALAAVVVLIGTFGLGYVVGTRADRAVVPSMVGLGAQGGGQAAARAKLAQAGLRLGKVQRMLCASDENGLVVRQSLPAGTSVARGSTINITIGDDGTHLIGLFVRDPHQPCVPGKQEPAGAVLPS